MENNKKKKYYQYYKNNGNNNQYNHHKYYYKRKKKRNNNNVVNTNNNISEDNNITKKVLMIDEDIDYNEYSGLLKKKVINLDEDIVSEPIIENNINNEVNNINEEDLLIKKEPEQKKENTVNCNNAIDNQNTINIENEKPKERKSLIIGTRLGYLLGVFIIIAALFSSSYAFFNYNKEDTRQADIVAGEVYVKVSENNLNLSLVNQYPRTIMQARSRNDNYIDFHVVGKNTSLTKVLGYKFTLVNGNDVSGKNRINPDYILFDLAVLDNNDNETLLLSGVKQSDFNSANISGFYIPTETNSEIQKKYRIRAWISEDVTISDDPTENATYTQQEYANLFANYKVHVNSQDRILNIGHEAVMKAVNAKINAGTCNPIWVDDNDTPNDDTDDITYFSGTNNCIDMNYVWYSGKLWRITAIYPDGAMKLVTEDALTAINWGSTVEYDGSWVYQWLNEDFYDTLVNPSDILISDATWNYSEDGNSTPVRPESIATQKTKEAPIGLLNAYEYYNAYRNASLSTNYLIIGYFWWLITPYSTSNVRHVYSAGDLSSNAPAGSSYGVRPSINLKSGLEFTGSGSKSNPYKIKGDMEGPTNNVTLLSSRSIGEYVKFDNDIYRIVSIDEENGTTKLTRVDYLRDNGTVITKHFASTVYFGKSTNTGSDTYWDYYLNNTWYNSISSTYKDMLIDGTYYLGLYAGSGKHYKITICKDTASTLDSITTKNCTKYTSEDTNKTFTGKVGLPRVGEMFSSQLGSGYSSSSDMWLITPYSTSSVRLVNYLGHFNYDAPASYSNGVRPSINLKSGIKITGGTGYVGGDTNSPFEISE